MTDVIRHFHHRRILPSMLLIAITTITAFVPFTAPVSADALCGSTRVALRTRKPTALAELPFALSPEVFGTAPVDYAALPPDMKEFAPEPRAVRASIAICLPWISERIKPTRVRLVELDRRRIRFSGPEILQAPAVCA